MSFRQLAAHVQGHGTRLLGEQATYTPKGGSPLPEPVLVVFDDAHVSQVDGAMREVSTISPTCTLNLADLPAEPRQGDSLDILGTTYLVDDVQPDGLGGASLLLLAL